MSVINATPLLAAAGGDYQISRSVRLRSSASAYFNRTPASAGNRKTWTWSGWVKVGTLGVNRGLFGAQTTAGADTNRLLMWLNSSDKIIVYEDISGTGNTYRLTTQVFRDPSAWYHIVLAFDTSNATAGDRVKLYVNGSQITTFDTNNAPTLNRDTFVNAALPHSLGADRASSLVAFDGYLTEINFIDGQALTPSSFGETDSITGVWKPKKYAGTYGTNGFYLNFSDNSSNTATTIGKDNSGNGNNWTPNNISVTAGATYDSMLDVPTLYADGGNGRGNYATLNPLIQRWAVNAATFSEGNLRVTTTNASSSFGIGTMFVATGKWYWEGLLAAVGTGTCAFSIGDNQVQSGTFTNMIAYNRDGTRTGGSAWASYTTNDIIGVALDCDSGTVSFYKNNTLQGSISLTAGVAYAPIADVVSNAVWQVNFGQRPFSYTPPTGFKALNTQNLPEPTIKKGNAYFDATLYTGNGTTQSIVNSGSMQPDLVWYKSRSAALFHHVFDSNRGANKQLHTNDTGAESTQTQALTSFNSNGFTVGSNVGGNQNGTTYVGWQWKESPSAGFDIVTYTGNGTAGRTVAHNLGVAPAMMIVKSRSDVTNWNTYHRNAAASPGTVFLNLNQTIAATADVTAWNNTAPTSSVFTVGSGGGVNTNGATYVAYLFAEVAGFSKFGSYTGNGSADGPFVFCGFRPKFVMVKRTDTTNFWLMMDTTRNTYNVMGDGLLANTSGAEFGWNPSKDILSNGFKVRTSDAAENASGGTYIFAAFAENPAKYALAR